MMKQITFRRKYGVHRFGVRRTGISSLFRLLIGVALFHALQAPVQAQTVVANGTVTVASGVGSTGDIIRNAGILNVLSGGAVASTTISAGGTLDVQTGGGADLTVISSGGVENLGALATDAQIQVSAGGLINIASGADVGGGGTVATPSIGPELLTATIRKPSGDH